MLTLFTTPKKFQGYFGTIQRNAIMSWTRIQPRPEIILFGDEDGSEQIANEAGLRRITDIGRNERGTPLISDLFYKAQQLAAHEILCYVNADIILPRDFSQTVQRVASWRNRFLLVGRRFNVDLDQPEIYDSPENEERLISLVKSQNKPLWIGALDYLVFPRGQYLEIPPFAIGRGGWDNWLLWKARSMRIPLIDASDVVMAIHQNHDYSYGAERSARSIWDGSEEVKRNGELAGNSTYTLDDITHKLTPKGIRRDFRNRLLKHTRSMRQALGLTHENLQALKSGLGPAVDGKSSTKGS
jgi:hypothetical protein